MNEPAASALPAIDFPVVGIGASAGGLEAVSEFLAELPAATGMAYVLVQHLDPSHASMLTEILEKKSAIPVAEAKDGMPVAADHLYVIPPNATLAVQEGRLRLTPRADGSRALALVDALFRSLAAECGQNAIGVVLSGTGSDGTRGIQAIREAGGIAFAQQPESARFDSMPKSALQTGCVDFALPPGEIARKLAGFREHPYLRGDRAEEAAELEPGSADRASEAQTWTRIFRLLRGTSGVDFTHYKRSTLERRVARRQALARIDELERYADFLQDTPGEQEALARDMLIGVTSFFRDSESFEGLAQIVFPALLHDRPPRDAVRVWVPGCASGEEVYSIAIALIEALGERAGAMPIQMFGTDAAEAAIARARDGRYPDGIANEVSPERLHRFFVKQNEHYEVAKSLRDLCVFARHDVTRDPPFSRLDLVSCRNLLIYLDPALQRAVFALIHYSLKPQGFLLLGPSEAIGQSSDLFELVDKKHRIYARRAVLGHPELPFRERKAAAAHPEAGRAAPVAAVLETDRMQGEADRVLLARYAPACVLVDEALNVHQFRGKTAPFLEHASGAASLNLQKLAPPALLVALSPAIQEARKGHAPVRRENVRIESQGSVREVHFEVSPFRVPETEVRGYLVVFEEARAERGRPGLWQLIFGTRAGAAPGTAAAPAEVEQLQQELASTREFLRTAVEEHEAATEELKSANEEALSSNEEYQSTNEELETAREELQSTNEELATTNDELRHRNQELVELNDKLNEARDFAEAIVETVHDPLLVLDERMHVLRANRAFYGVFQVPAADIEGRYLFELGSGQWNIPALRALLGKVLEDEKPIEGYEVSHAFPQIGERVMIVNARRLSVARGESDLILLGIEDATERLSAAEARVAAERLREVDRTKNEFLAMVSHELRNPLAPIRATLEVMRRERTVEPKLARGLDLVHRQVEQLVRLVDDLLDVSSIAQHQFTMLAQPILLSDAVDRAIEASVPLFNSRRQRFSVTLPPEPIQVAGDTVRLTQVFVNLLANAAKFTPDGSAIWLSIDLEEAHAVVTIADEGRGIEAGLLPHVFDLFMQSRPLPGRAPSGMGVGLTLARRIVELHGGTIEARSEGGGKGSAFTVRLPIVENASAAPKVLAMPDGPPKGARRRVLVVDDNADAAESMRDLLELEGCEVRCDYSGAAGLQTAMEFEPELVLLDIGLPGMDGYEMLRRLRALPGPRPVVAAVTGYGHPAERERIKLAEFDRELTKPADPKLLYALLESLNKTKENGE